jgi:Na+/citrate or Na+/malate symporter
MENKAGLMSKADLILFFQELFGRLGQRSPKFFRVIGWVSVLMACVGVVPDAMTFFEYNPPQSWMPMVGKMMTAAGVWGKLMSSLAVSKPTTEILPFTEKKQIQQELNASK